MPKQVCAECSKVRIGQGRPQWFLIGNLEGPEDTILVCPPCFERLKEQAAAEDAS